MISIQDIVQNATLDSAAMEDTLGGQHPWILALKRLKRGPRKYAYKFDQAYRRGASAWGVGGSYQTTGD